MDYNKHNIILIGMPGSGKSTVGVILAKNLGMKFVDTDILIQSSEQRTLQEIVNSEGHMSLRQIEENVLLKVNCVNSVVATGGSAAYSDKAMIHLGQSGIIVFLNAQLSTLQARIHNYNTRGLAKRPDQSFDDLFQERYSLYKKYADITVDCDFIDQDTTAATISKQLQQQIK